MSSSPLTSGRVSPAEKSHIIQFQIITTMAKTLFKEPVNEYWVNTRDGDLISIFHWKEKGGEMLYIFFSNHLAREIIV